MPLLFDPVRGVTPARRSRRAGLVASIGEAGIGIHGTPRRVHCGLFTKPLLLFDFGGGAYRKPYPR